MSENIQKVELAAFNSTPPTIRSETFETLYANAIKMGISPWDLRIVFSQTLESSPGEVANKEMICIVMSPQQAKAAMLHWINTVKMYEETFGPILDVTDLLAKQASVAAPADGVAAIPKKKKS